MPSQTNFLIVSKGNKLHLYTNNGDPTDALKTYLTEYVGFGVGISISEALFNELAYSLKGDNTKTVVEKCVEVINGLVKSTSHKIIKMYNVNSILYSDPDKQDI